VGRITDRIAEQIAAAIEKRALPAGAVTMTEQDMRNGSIGQSYGNNVPLGREAFLPVAFGPGVPITPGAINELREDGRPDPRRWEFQVAQNINVTETRLIPFKTLRAAADQIALDESADGTDQSVNAADLQSPSGDRSSSAQYADNFTVSGSSVINAGTDGLSETAYSLSLTANGSGSGLYALDQADNSNSSLDGDGYGKGIGDSAVHRWLEHSRQSWGRCGWKRRHAVFHDQRDGPNDWRGDIHPGVWSEHLE